MRPSVVDGTATSGWTRSVPPAAGTEPLPHYRRDWVRFLQSPGWILALVYLVCSGAAFGLTRIDPHRKYAEGVQWLALPLAAIAASAILLAFLLYLDKRLVFGQVFDPDAETRRSQTLEIIGWGILSGIVGVGFAVLFEWGVPKLFHSDFKAEDIWHWLPGPAEEFGKVLVPVVLWFAGRYRLPRQGFLLVVISGITFGVIEGGEYGAMPDQYQITRPFGELMHPMLAGITAAVAWRFAWGRKSWFTVPGVAALLAMMGLHSANDGLIQLAGHEKFLSIITVVVFVVLYFGIKFSARQMVPPDNVAAVPPMWRPVPPKRSHGSI